MPSAKARVIKAHFFRSAEALLPPHKCGGSHQEAHSRVLRGEMLMNNPDKDPHYETRSLGNRNENSIDRQRKRMG